MKKLSAQPAGMSASENLEQSLSTHRRSLIFLEAVVRHLLRYQLRSALLHQRLKLLNRRWPTKKMAMTPGKDDR